MTDYFDRFLAEVKKYHVAPQDFRPESELQVAIYYQRGCFDFCQTYDKFVEDNYCRISSAKIFKV